MRKSTGLSKDKARALLCLLIVIVFLVYTNQRFLFWDETEKRIVDVLPRDPAEIPPIFHPAFVSAGDSYLEENDIVVGVVVNGEPKAYPIIVLDRHEVVDDVIGNVPVVVSFCPLTGSAVAFQRPENVFYGVSGKLLRNNLVMYDNKTGSLWSQIMMRAVQGPLKGEPLKVLPSHLMEWTSWVTLFPNTKLLALPTTFKASEYIQNRFTSYRNSSDPGIFPVERLSDAVPFKEYVLGVRLDGATKAYPFSVLSRQSLLVDRLKNEKVIVTFCGGSAQAFKADHHEFQPQSNCRMQDEEGNVWNTATGEQLDGGEKLQVLTYVIVYWFAWYDFNPDTSLYADQEV
jgi:hypothetical protein